MPLLNKIPNGSRNIRLQNSYNTRCIIIIRDRSSSPLLSGIYVRVVFQKYKYLNYWTRSITPRALDAQSIRRGNQLSSQFENLKLKLQTRKTIRRMILAGIVQQRKMQKIKTLFYTHAYHSLHIFYRFSIKGKSDISLHA